ncbi:unnamed protein product [Acanthoscelides obtectus]|uniref:PHD-type domain-containing protein n=1 Tax=Acanthoscelides obtectus TaxID=200917 RepID=A0A9P0NTN1_ACAOB|nr:unnamed protein product [Acanthoscelides obtectus]CAK1654414.1 hypothetical protein AOBTE_LOCUS18570 [Acanthoscelides obtectus]
MEKKSSTPARKRGVGWDEANMEAAILTVGIYPFNPDAIPATAFAPSILTQRLLPDTNRPEDVDQQPSTSKGVGKYLFAGQKENATSHIVDSSDSEDDLPLQELQKRIHYRSRTSFQKLLATPDMKQAVTVKLPRKKAMNYKAQTITKDLFQQNPSSSRIVPDQVADWYCPACKENRLSDMRQCMKCQVWYHEECVGLTESDLIFECPEC